MKLVVTGGGTGGHVYPALVVAEHLAARGAELTYLGSLRGQEAETCARRGIPFQGYPSAPLYSLRTLRGWRSLATLLRSRSMAIKTLRQSRADVVFSTGGYSAGPVVAAARALRIPYVIHEANSVPGRANLMFANQASAFTCVFKCTPGYAPGVKVTRTGQPIRPELRTAAQQSSPCGDGSCAGGGGEGVVLVLGGSQGSEFLNTIVPLAAHHLSGVSFIHAAGPKNIDHLRQVLYEYEIVNDYDARPYLDTPELVAAYRQADIVIARSGGTLAEIAMFGLPSILVPLPTSADDHQLHNAREFDAMGAATLLPQPMDPALYQDYAVLMAQHLETWLSDAAKREAARKALKEWDIPDATERIGAIVEQAANQHA